jgi:phosphomannomutase
MNMVPVAAECPWKPCDLRGVYPDSVSPALFRAIGSAIGTMLAWHARVVVAGDFRLSTLELKRALSDGLQQAGIRVLDAGQGPTPLAYFAAQQLHADAVLIVTASHNPADHNGLKLMLGSVPTTPQQLSAIRAVAEARTFREDVGNLETVDLVPIYRQQILQRWAHLRDRPRRVVLDAGNGAWSELAPAIFRELGCEIECVSCVADGRFPDRSPDCAKASSLTRLSAAVQEWPDAIGIAWDGDGDRVAFIDEAGSYVTPDEIAILFSEAMLADKVSNKDGNAKIVVDVKCSDVVRRSILRYGGMALLERTGHAFMRSRMVAEEGLLGLDACGHYFFRELSGGDDGLFAALYLLSILQDRGQSLEQLRNTLPQIFSTPEIRVPKIVMSYTEASAALTAAFPEASVVDIDGLRLVTEGGIVLVRESGTEPVISLRIEGFDGPNYGLILARSLQSLPEAASRICRESLPANAQ